ncbi:hypothetical protein BDR06DRAFT_975598 [Suillus hirtellus]|nr:hypothetical protein BDR06DRAFT_975598 [Suillus hirtellus]
MSECLGLQRMRLPETDLKFDSRLLDNVVVGTGGEKADNDAPAAQERRDLIKTHAAKPAVAPTPTIPPPTLPTVVLTFEFFELGVESPVSQVDIGDTLLGVGVEDPTLVLEDGASIHNIQELQLWNTVKSSILAGRSNSPLDCDAITNVRGVRQRVGYCIAALARFGSVEQKDLYTAHLQG